MEGDGIHRKEIPEIPVDAMREAVFQLNTGNSIQLPIFCAYNNKKD